MKVPLKYSFRNILARRLTAALTIFGVTLVTFVFAGVLMLSNGLRQIFITAGSPENVIALRESSTSEIMSFINREQSDIIGTLPEIAVDPTGGKMVEGEVVVMINRSRRLDEKMANIMVRGIGPKSMTLHPRVRLNQGRMFDPGKNEIIAGIKAAELFQGCGLGETIKFGMADWTVVGLFEAAGSSFESELWGDVDQFKAAFNRPVYSSMIFKLADPATFEGLRDRLKADPRMTLELKREAKYYEDQSQASRTFINYIGTTLSLIFSLGAIIGAMITMYGAVANRTTEIATMRALGFRRRNILAAFLVESILIALMGGALGLVAASFLQFASVPLLNFDTFSEVSFNFALSLEIIIEGLIFAVIMGIVGGFLPAVRASRIKITEALRAE